jgi:hypothetical protein
VGNFSERNWGDSTERYHFVFPLMFVLMFGIVEYGIAMGNSSTVKQASRSSVRMVATSPKLDAYALAADAAKIDLSAGANVGPQELWIFKAIVDSPTPSLNGFPVSGNGSFTGPGSCPASTCMKFLWNPSTHSWNAPSGSWAPSAQNACLGAGTHQYPDAVGVYVKTRYTFFTGLFGDGMDLTAKTVMRLEPVPIAQGCTATT